MVQACMFHKTVAALLNARAPHGVVVFGSSSMWAPAYLSDLVGTCAYRRFVIYSGASPFSALNTWMSSLYSTSVSSVQLAASGVSSGLV